MLIAALFTVANAWKQPVVFVEDWIKRCGTYILRNTTQQSEKMKSCPL